MGKLTSGIPKAIFLIFQFLIEFDYYLFLFTIPLLILTTIQSPVFIAAAMALIGIGKIGAVLAIKYQLKNSKLRFLYILAFAIQLLIICLLNKSFNSGSVLIATFFWSFSYCLLRFAGQTDLQEIPSQIVTGWEFLQRPVKAAVLVLAPVFGTFLAFVTGTAGFVSYLGILASLAALVYMIFIARRDKDAKLCLDQKKKGVSQSLFKSINKTTVLTGFLLGYFWVFAPLHRYHALEGYQNIYWILIWLNIPYLLILIWKNIFKMRVWQLKPQAKYLLFSISLLCFCFNPAGIYLFLAVSFLGIVLGLVQSSDAQEGEYAGNFISHQFNFGIGFSAAMLIGSISTYANYFELILAGTGVLTLLYSLIRIFGATLDQKVHASKKPANAI